MDRRGFLRMLPALVGGVALEQAIPLGRVWSFPTKLVLPPRFNFKAEYEFDKMFARPFPVGSPIQIRVPRRYKIAGANFEFIPEP